MNHVRGTQLFVVLALVAALFAGIRPAGAVRAAEAPVAVAMDEYGRPLKTYFPETGHHLSTALLQAWNSTGLMIFGYPISEPLVEKGRTVQYFERARLEVWPEHSGSQWEVQGTLIGNWKVRNRLNEAPFRRLPAGTVSDDPNRVIVEETGHSLAFGFKKYWEQNGGLWQYGYPISEEFSEGGYTVQYFERARFEFHPENQGTQYEVLLGLLGKDLADTLLVPQATVLQSNDAVKYNVGLFQDAYLSALRTEDNSFWASVATDAVSVRDEPRADANASDIIYNRRPVIVRGIVRGDDREGVDAWYKLGDGQYVPAVYFDPLVLNTPGEYFSGHWIDVNLSQFYATAYDGTTPVYTAIVAAGREGRTPVGVFNILSQVRSEIMDSATVGIPKGAPGYYYLENVEFTQYFLGGGFAVHGNYWTPEANFGNFTSNGCVGLMNVDAAIFWDWLNQGDVVSIHF